MGAGAWAGVARLSSEHRDGLIRLCVDGHTEQSPCQREEDRALSLKESEPARMLSDDRLWRKTRKLYQEEAAVTVSTWLTRLHSENKESTEPRLKRKL